MVLLFLFRVSVTVLAMYYSVVFFSGIGIAQRFSAKALISSILFPQNILSRGVFYGIIL
jgi:hypothetical protein